MLPCCQKEVTNFLPLHFATFRQDSPTPLPGGAFNYPKTIKMGKNVHVVPHNGKWGVRSEGNKKLTAITDTQAESAAKARQIARNQESELFIHGRNGRICKRNSYGNDPYPPAN